MALSWSPWIVLDREHVEQLGPMNTGLYEVKVDAKLIDYPRGKSAMIYYGCTNGEAATIREAVQKDWMVDDKAELRSAWSAYGELVWRFALQPEPDDDHARRIENFAQRFGRTPWANPDAGAPSGGA